MAPKNGTMQGFFRLTDAEKPWSSSFSRFAKRPAASSFTSAIFSGVETVGEKEAYHLNLTKSESGVSALTIPS